MESAPNCTNGYYNDHRGIPIFHIPSGPQAIVHKCKRFLLRDGNYFHYLSLLDHTKLY